MNEGPVLWLDIVNPSDVWFFKPFLTELSDLRFKITLRDRAETVALARSNGIQGEVIGAHHTDRLGKYVGTPMRFVKLFAKVNQYDIGLYFEYGLDVVLSKLKGKPSILFCDNDLKLIESSFFLQDVENKVKVSADYIVIPETCFDTYGRFARKERIITYDGYKEDIYIADYSPDEDFRKKLPLEDYVVIRPEALDSSYVGKTQTIVPQLLSMFTKEHMPIVYLPRTKHDFEYARGFDVHVPSSPLNGLDLCFHALAVLTGSGTMAREAACMGKPAISFFPGKHLLSVDSKLIRDGKMTHSRDPNNIVASVVRTKGGKIAPDFHRSRQVKISMMKSVRKLIDDLSPSGRSPVSLS